MFKTVRSTIILLILLTIILGSAGCGTSEQATLADMMKVVPRETDSLFVVGIGILQVVPDLGEMWNTLAEETLPAGAVPASLGIASQNGTLTGLCYTFEGDIPTYEDGTGEQLKISNLSVTRTDNFWDSFTLGNVLVVSVKDYTAQTITDYKESGNTMDAEFRDMINELPEGAFMAGVCDITIGGKNTILAISLDYGADKEDPLGVTGVFKISDGSTVAVADFLERCAIKDARITSEDGLIKVTGLLNPADFSDLMNMLTRSW